MPIVAAIPILLEQLENSKGTLSQFSLPRFVPIVSRELVRLVDAANGDIIHYYAGSPLSASLLKLAT